MDREIDYYDDEETVKYFWECSIENKMDDFDFILAITHFKDKLYEKLAVHGQLEYDTFVDYMIEMNNYSILEDLEVKNDWIYIPADELEDVILRHMYLRYQQEFSDYEEFRNLQELHDTINDFITCPSDFKRKDRVLLYDKCIHAEHVNGFIMEIYNMDAFREDFEKTYKKCE